MTIVGAALLRAVRLADAAVHVEHDGGLRLAGMHLVDPRTGQIGQGREVGIAGQPLRLEATHLARRGGLTIQPAAIDHGAHRRIMCQAVGVIDVLIAGKTAEHRLAQQSCQQVAGVLAAPALRQHRTRQVGQAKRVIELTVGQQPGVGGDPTAMKFQPQAAVEIDPQGTVIRFTRWVSHARAPELRITRCRCPACGCNRITCPGRPGPAPDPKSTGTLTPLSTPPVTAAIAAIPARRAVTPRAA